MFAMLAVILVIAWLLGFGVFHVAGGLIHLLLLLAVIALWHLVTGRRMVWIAAPSLVRVTANPGPASGPRSRSPSSLNSSPALEAFIGSRSNPTNPARPCTARNSFRPEMQRLNPASVLAAGITSERDDGGR
jgi:hypothetical protein